MLDYVNFKYCPRRASQLVERGDYEEALLILQDLLSSDISDVDKAMMCLNVAIVYDKLDRPADALAYYERDHGLHTWQKCGRPTWRSRDVTRKAWMRTKIYSVAPT